MSRYIVVVQYAYGMSQGDILEFDDREKALAAARSVNPEYQAAWLYEVVTEINVDTGEPEEWEPQS